MKRVKRIKRIVLLCATLLFALALWAGISPPVSSFAKTADFFDDLEDLEASAYDFTVDKYDIVMNVAENREISVTEVICVSLEGYASHGIIRDLTLDNGVKYRNITASCDNSDFEYYAESGEGNFLSVYLRGDKVARGQTRTYTLNYTMIVPVLSEEGYLPLDVVGYGWTAEINDVTVTLNLPAALMREQMQLYSGESGTRGNDSNVAISITGNTVVLTAQKLLKEQGITLDLSFPAGILKKGTDLSILWATLIAVALIGLALVVKVVKRKPVLTVTVNLRAPEEMDPLKMGKLIDNSVDSEDMGAEVFYLADKGYLTIDLNEDKDDPTLSKTVLEPPEDAPMQQKLLYNGLFEGRDRVKISDLNASFYKTSDAIRSSVHGVTKGMYSAGSIFFIVFFSILCVLVPSLFALFYTNAFVSIEVGACAGVVAGCVIAMLCALIPSVIAEQRLYKWSAGHRIGVRIAGLFVGCVIGFIAWLVLPATRIAYGIPTGLLLVLPSGIVGLIAGNFLTRTREYNDILGHIVGFKNFILYTERDKIKFMLDENPTLYYHVLPYAQVLGVTDAWTDKFQGIDMPAPSYVYYGTADAVFDCLFWHSMFRSFNRNIAREMISRPSTNGTGKIGGGFGGGFGGGGFGGGGGRGC